MCRANKELDEFLTMNERQIFEQAIEISDETQREAFLVEICGPNTALRNRIDGLLHSHQSAEFLDTPVLEQLDQLKSLECDATIQSAARTSCDEMSTSSPDEDESIDLSYLTPAQQSGSLGRLGHYEIIQVLGRGAFGVVFKAFDAKLHRYVAVKVLNAELAKTSPPRKRFLREARSIAAVNHENIVQVYAVEEQPVPYLVMEYVAGQTLAEKLERSGPLDISEWLSFGRQMAAGLSAAHEQGVIHRDIKPSNVLIEDGIDAKLKITDFGLARAADDASVTRTGTIAGTPMYMAPEQITGNQIDHRADLFSLGSVLYQMASGRPPFRGPNAIAVMKRVVDETPRPISEILSEVPDWVCAIIAKLQSKHPDGRFQTARELATLLADCQREMQSLAKADMSHVHRLIGHSIPTQQETGPTHASDQRSSTGSSGWERWAVIAAMMLCIGGFSYWQLANRQTVRSRVSERELPIMPENKSTTAAEPILNLSDDTSTLSESAVWSAPTNLGSHVNTAQRESNPSLTTDGMLLVFTRGGEFFQSRRTSLDEPFGQATKLNGPFQASTLPVSISISGDGLLAVYSSAMPGDKYLDVKLAQRRTREDVFEESSLLPTAINSAEEERYPILSPDGLVLAFTTYRANYPRGSIFIHTRDSTDSEFRSQPIVPEALQIANSVVSSFMNQGRAILMSTMQSKFELTTWHSCEGDLSKWSVAKPIPSSLGQLSLGKPTLSADGAILLFHSRAIDGGYGDLDIWMCKRLNYKTP